VLPIILALAGTSFAATPPGARPGTGRLAVSTQPTGATIYVDGHPSGKAPAEVDGLGPGRYFVRAELDGYRPAETVIEISSSQANRSVAFELISTSAPRPVEVAPAPAVVAPKPTTPIPATPAPVRAATPAPVEPIAVAPPRATPAPVAAPAPAVPVAAGGGEADETILGLVSAHLKSISEGDIDAYLRLCAAKVDLYDEGMQSKDSIRRSRQKLKERWPVYEISNVREVAVRPTDKVDVKRAAVTYDWNVSNPKTGKKANGTASDFLDFKQVDGQWLIVKARQNVERKKSSSQ
jgi:hypothetical protein